MPGKGAKSFCRPDNINTSIALLDLKVPIDIDKVLVLPGGPQRIKQAMIREILPALKEGVKILNTNIPEHILKNAGLKTEQYANIHATLESKQNKNPSKKPGRQL